MLNIGRIQLPLLVIAWIVSEVLSDSCSSSCMKSILEVPCVPLRNDYVHVPGVGAYKLHTNATDWNTARHICKQEDSHLAVINSVAEAKAISTIFTNGGTISGTGNQKYVFIGFHDQFKEGEYVTIFSQTLSKAGYDIFAPGEPNNGGGAENCGSITRAGLLNDINCTFNYGFICELPLCISCRSS